MNSRNLSRPVIIAALAAMIPVGVSGTVALAGPAMSAKRHHKTHRRAHRVTCASLRPKFRAVGQSRFGVLFTSKDSEDLQDLGVCVPGGRLLLARQAGSDTEFTSSEFSQPKIAGPFAAFVRGYTDYTTAPGGTQTQTSCGVTLMSLRPPFPKRKGPRVSRTRQTFSGAPRVLKDTSFLTRPPTFTCDVPGFFLTPGGTVAWLEPVSDPKTGKSTAVRTMDATGVHLLDTGTEIPASSFRLNDHTLSWTNAGQPRTAQVR